MYWLSKYMKLQTSKQKQGEMAEFPGLALLVSMPLPLPPLLARKPMPLDAHLS